MAKKFKVDDKMRKFLGMSLIFVAFFLGYQFGLTQYDQPDVSGLTTVEVHGQEFTYDAGENLVGLGARTVSARFMRCYGSQGGSPAERIEACYLYK
ncbi:hypothetical protein GOV11_05010 [Candidatus Woesearchaeota archaeon]|nr:hypothetical protein [Candidatus Woesearchaeota archaeon]